MMLEQIVGAAPILLFLGDIFLTVLYARAGTGWLAPHWSRAVWGPRSAPQHGSSAAAMARSCRSRAR